MFDGPMGIFDDYIGPDPDGKYRCDHGKIQVDSLAILNCSCLEKQPDPFQDYLDYKERQAYGEPY